VIKHVVVHLKAEGAIERAIIEFPAGRFSIERFTLLTTPASETNMITNTIKFNVFNVLIEFLLKCVGH
jgi:hypothetical protein